MNPFFVIALGAILLEYGLQLAANWLNLKSLSHELPPELAGLYPPEEYRRSQGFTRAATRFDFVKSTFGVALLLGFWFSGGFNWLDGLVQGLSLNPILTGVAYIGVLFISYGLVNLPFAIYATFSLEERFGFNRTTPRTFLRDQMMGLSLAIALGGPLLAGILALFQFAGGYAWLLCWAVVVAFSLVIQYISPTLIMPLFNTFKPMEPGPLRDAILDYASSVRFPVSNVSVMDGSKRSSRANAFFTGFGRTKRIALFDTLVAQHPVPELVAVLAHEIGHYKRKHVIHGTVIGVLHAGLVFFLLSLFLGSPGLYQAFRVDQPSVYTGLLFFGLLYTPIELVLSIAMKALSRRNEYEADRFAATTIRDPRAMVESLKKLHAHNLANLTPHPFYVFLNYSHPPLSERIRAVERVSARRS